MVDVQHRENDQKFVIRQGGNEAVLAYRLHSVGDAPEIDFYSTYVPPEFRGQGLAEKLVRTGLRWAREQGFQVHASCWYVAKFLR